MSITRRKTTSGTRYVVRWRESGRGSRQHKATFGPGPNAKDDAERFELERRRRQQLGVLYSEVRGSEQTVADFVQEWWTKYALPRLAPGTLASYAYVLDRWIVPYLGSIRLRELSRESIDEFCVAARRNGAGVPTVNRCLGILQGILQRAVEWRRLVANPVAGARRMAHGETVIDAKTPELVERIRAALKSPQSSQSSQLAPSPPAGSRAAGVGSTSIRGLQAPLRDAVLVSVLAYEALRPAEAFALTWADVLTEEGKPRRRLRVQRALSDHKLSTTKTRRAREPELFGPVAQDLAELYLSVGRPPFGTLVFPDSEGGYLRRQNWRKRVWLPALAAVDPCGECDGQGELVTGRCEACGGKGSSSYFPPKDLRHACASLMIQAGWPLTEVSAHLGHADVAITAKVYVHLFADARDRRGVSVEQAIVQARQTARAVVL